MSRYWRVARNAGALLVLIGAFCRGAAADTAEPPPRLYLNCTVECQEPYLRQALSYFDLVRDRYLAEYELLIAAQANASGGTAYTVTLLRRASAAPSTLSAAAHTAVARGTRQVTRARGQAPSAFREQLLDAALHLLYAETTGSRHQSHFRLSLPPRSNDTLASLVDPWDYWVIIPELTGEGEGGSGYHSVEVGGAVTVRRITDRHKLRLRLGHWQAFSAFVFEDGSAISGNTYGIDSNAVYARSLGDHFALGATGTFRTSKYENLKLHAHYGPVLEANAFPYAQNATRQLRFVYQVGVWYNEYFERNAQGRWSELQYYHALSSIADVNQAWGSVQLAAQLNSFIREPSRLRLSLGGQLTLLLLEGLALELEGETSWVKDQISVRQRALEDREVLLFTAEQPTRFIFEFTLGFSYAFGSVHNTIVNPRFGRIDLTEE
jgi:hypothetical protein